MDAPSDVTSLVEQLKALPLLSAADLDLPGVAYEGFDYLASAILGAALLLAPEDERKGQNGRLFVRFVVEHFPEGRGRGDRAFAGRLWAFRNGFVKGRRARPIRVTHRHPELHLVPADDGRPIVNLESFVSDFREAVDSLGAYLDSTPELRERAAAEVAARRLVVSVVADDLTTSLSLHDLDDGHRDRRGNRLKRKALVRCRSPRRS
jgi:hypothetical protein